MRSLFVVVVLVLTFQSLVIGSVKKSFLDVANFRTDDDKSRFNEFDFSKQLELVAEATSTAGTSSIASSTFNLAKTILGAGVLSLPSGIAAFSDSKTALLPSTVLLLSMGLISAYSFSSIGKACEIHETTTFSEAWSKSVDMPGVIISSAITFKTFFACLAYSIIIGDSFSQIFKYFGAPSYLSLRSNVIVGLTSLIIFPLCCLRKLDALKYTSILGLGGTVYCAVFMAIRYFDGSYAAGGKFFDTIDEKFRPLFGESAVIDSRVFHLIAMISSAYVAHYNAPKFWTELQRPTAKRYNTVVAAAFGFAAVTYALVLWVGFLTFGGHSSGLILNNYSNSDQLCLLARIAIGFGILCGYPLTFTALRDGMMELLQINSSRRDALTFPFTAALLALLTSFALVLKNVGMVVSFGGALIGSMLIFTIPALMNIRNLQRVALPSFARSLQLAANYGMAVMGVVTAIIGVYLNLKNMAAGH